MNDNYYSTDFYEIFYGLYGYSLIDFQGYILDQSSEYIETIPLYRYYSSELNRNFYTTDLTELDNEFFSSFTFDNIQGYVFTEEFEGVVPLYRFVDRENH